MGNNDPEYRESVGEADDKSNSPSGERPVPPNDGDGTSPAAEPLSGKAARKSIQRIEQEIAELKARMPAHSVKPSMVQQLEELEERLDAARKEAGW
jgi:hypothetical protein